MGLKDKADAAKANAVQAAAQKKSQIKQRVDNYEAIKAKLYKGFEAVMEGLEFKLFEGTDHLAIKMGRDENKVSMHFYVALNDVLAYRVRYSVNVDNFTVSNGLMGEMTVDEFPSMVHGVISANIDTHPSQTGEINF